jgi:hypothetical protein
MVVSCIQIITQPSPYRDGANFMTGIMQISLTKDFLFYITRVIKQSGKQMLGIRIFLCM